LFEAFAVMGFKLYKRGQGYHTRLWSGLIAFAIVVVGCYRLYQKLQIYNKLFLQTLVPTGVCVLFGLFIYWLVNKPSVADFMIAAEGELKKVSWSTRREIAVSTIVVICVVALLALLLTATDFGFQLLFRSIGLY
jgi:preprotein translocase subunit SecE